MGAKFRIPVLVEIVAPDDQFATVDEAREALEEAIAGMGEFDVRAMDNEDGEEVWMVDAAHADMPND
jgi:hypothetical protein